MADEKASLVALMTDFGYDDPWVASMKAVLFSINPAIKTVDITHSVPPHDIFSGALTLYRSYRDFPTGTVFLCVVDPGVGSGRLPLIVSTDNYYFVGPDNGIFSFIYAYEEHKVTAVDADYYFRKPVSETFHGRDVFAPVAAWLTRKVDVFRFGPTLNNYIKKEVPVDEVAEGSISGGEVCSVDRFGNLITNVRLTTMKKLALASGRKSFQIDVAGKKIPLLSGGYKQDAPLFALINSSGLLEITSFRKSAAELLGVSEAGTKVGVSVV